MHGRHVEVKIRLTRCNPLTAVKEFFVALHVLNVSHAVGAEQFACQVERLPAVGAANPSPEPDTVGFRCRLGKSKAWACNKSGGAGGQPGNEAAAVLGNWHSSPPVGCK